MNMYKCYVNVNEFQEKKIFFCLNIFRRNMNGYMYV